MKPLTELDKTVAIASLVACKPRAGHKWRNHVPIEAICSRFRKDLRGMVKHSIKKKLVPLGYLKKHPTGNNMTYEVTKKCM